MVQNIRYAVAYRFFTYYFFTEKVIAICAAMLPKWGNRILKRRTIRRAAFIF